MKMKRLISGIIALVLIMGMPVSAFAADWYLEDGDITVSADNSGQTVSQGGGAAVADDAPVISQRDSSAATDSTITISTSDNATANVTIQDINISSTGDAIDVGSSSANITLEGDNKIFSESGSALHVSNGHVTITGSGSLTLAQHIESGAGQAALPALVIDGVDVTCPAVVLTANTDPENTANLIVCSGSLTCIHVASTTNAVTSRAIGRPKARRTTISIVLIVVFLLYACICVSCYAQIKPVCSISGRQGCFAP